MANDKQQPATEAPAATNTPEKTVLDLLATLTAGGTPPATLELIREYQKQNAGANPAEVLEHLTAQNVTPGTLRKVGQWLYGDGWDLAQPGLSTSDVVQQLREEVARLKETIRELEAKNVLMLRQNGDLTKRNAALNDHLQPERVKASETIPVMRPEGRKRAA